MPICFLIWLSFSRSTNGFLYDSYVGVVCSLQSILQNSTWPNHNRDYIVCRSRQNMTIAFVNVKPLFRIPVQVLMDDQTYT